METSRKRVVITGGTAAILLFAITVISKNNASVTGASRDEVESNPPTSSVITTTNSSTPKVTTTSSKVTTSLKTTTTTKTTEIDISESSSKVEATTTTTVTTSTEAVQQQSSNVENTTGYTWNEYSVNYVETNIIKEMTPTTATTIIKESEETTAMVEEKTVEEESKKWDGPVLNSYVGIVSGPSGNETYYNLNMSGVVANMESLGYDYDYWIRDDGVKMYGDYVMCAADLSTRPKGTVVETSLGEGIVCDTGGFVSWDHNRLDIATNW